MKADSITIRVAAAGCILTFLPAGACNGGSESNGGPLTRADIAAMEAAAEGQGADRWVDDRMRFLESFVLSNARSSERSFPAYNAWLSAMASSVRSGTSAPGPDSDLVTRAEIELAPYKRDLGETYDGSVMTAYEEGTRLGLLGERLAGDFAHLSSGARLRAANRLRERYALP